MMNNEFYMTLTQSAGSDTVLSSCLVANSTEMIIFQKDGDKLLLNQRLVTWLGKPKCLFNLFLVQNIFSATDVIKWSKDTFSDPSFSPLVPVNSMELFKGEFFLSFIQDNCLEVFL